MKNKNPKSKRFFLISVVLILFLASGCGPGQLLGPTFTPTPTMTPSSTPTPTPTSTPTPTLTPSITPTPTPFMATFDDNLCEIKGSFTIDGELYVSPVSVFGMVVENEPRYALDLWEYSSEFHSLTIWVKHSSSPGPNEMEDLREGYDASEILIYSTDKAVLHGDLEPVRLTVHVIPPHYTFPVDDVLNNCDYVVEEIQIR